MPQTEEAEGVVYRHIEDDVERIIPTQAKAQAHDSAQKVEIHPRWRHTPDLREWPPHWLGAEARTPARRCATGRRRGSQLRGC